MRLYVRFGAGQPCARLAADLAEPLRSAIGFVNEAPSRRSPEIVMSIARAVATSLVAAAAFSLVVGEASANTHGRSHVASAAHSRVGVRYAPAPSHGGYQPLVSDGYGTGFGFHRNPAPYRVGAAIARDRQRGAVRSAVLSSAIDSQPDGFGFYGDSVYGEGTNAAYGVFNGSDGYGSPYFAGYYGPGDGADYGVFGHGYAN